MEYVYLTDFFATYSLPTLVIAVAVSIITFITNKFLSDKISATARSYLPFILSIAMYLAYDMIFVCNAFKINVNSIYAGMLCGSMSLIIGGALARIKKGKPLSVSQTVLLIESILTGFVQAENLTKTATTVEGLIAPTEDATDTESIASAIKENSVEGITEGEFIRLAKLIITAIFSSNKSK